MQQFIDPKTLSRIKDMPLVAKTIAQGFLQGLHNSMQRGVGIEFSQYRVYEPGDDLAKVDWKLFARSDRYFVREAERESEINVWLVLDASNSMRQISQSSQQQGGWHKLDYGRYLLATIAYLAQKQGDAVGLLGLSTLNTSYLPAYSGERHWQKILLELTRMDSGGEFPDITGIQSQLNNMRKTGMIIVVSDFYQKDNEIIDFISQLVSPRTEVVAIQLSSEEECNFPFSGQIRFEDLESKQQRLVCAQDIRADYLSARHLFQESLARDLSQYNIKHFQANIDQPLDQTLYDFLRLRQKVK